MSELTPNLGLFKYNTETDGKEVFSIEQALNYNWDILDDMQKYLVTSYTDGALYYRQYIDGWKEQGGYIATTPTEAKWSQPALTVNGTMGGTSFAVAASREYSTYYAWKAFDGQTTTNSMWHAGTTLQSLGGASLTMYFPTPVKIKKLSLRNRNDNNSGVSSGIILAGDTSSCDTTVLPSFTNDITTKATWWDINVNSSAFYHYYKLQITGFTPSNVNVSIGEISIDATYMISAGSSVTFPVAFSDTNYNYNLGFQGGDGTGVYITTKTASGFNITNTPSATVSWSACGY